MVAMNFVFATLPDHRRHQGPHATAQGLNALLLPPGNRRSTYATMLAGALSYCAAMQIMLSYGAWLADQYQLGAAALGTVAFVLGWFDLIASVSVSVFTDRIGKRRSMLIGVAGSLVGYLLMPLLNLALLPAVAIIGVTRCFFEFSIVSHLPLLSEQMPAHRGKVMSLGAALSLGSSTVAAFSGPWLLVNLGVAALAWSSAALVLLSLLTILFLVRETPEIP
jgi:predicted MFS family arabinose efflux permease